ncbi:hypothetical protein AYI69_g9371, partial [Smittium culicis]
MSVVV